jgi:hypothetical protein
VLAGLGAAVDDLGTGGGVIEGVFSTATLGGGIEAEVGCLERGKYLSSKSALSEITVFVMRSNNKNQTTIDKTRESL